MTSTPSKTEVELQRGRIQANCKIIYASDWNYSFDEKKQVREESDQHYPNYFQVFIKNDYGNSFGPQLDAAGVGRTVEEAWVDLDKMLSLWVEKKQSGSLLNQEGHPKIFYGENWDHQFKLWLKGFKEGGSMAADKAALNGQPMGQKET